jgi:hypothetical protein
LVQQVPTAPSSKPSTTNPMARADPTSNRSYQDQWREGLLLPWYRIPWHRNEAAASELPTGEVAIGAQSRAEKWFARMGRKDLPLGCRAEARPQHDAARPIDRTTGGPSFEERRARRDPQSTMKPPIAQSMPMKVVIQTVRTNLIF